MHYLDVLKKILDSTFGNKTLHVCIEAAHPNCLGRPAEDVSNLLLSESFISAEHANSIRVNFIDDRYSVPELDGHVLVVGGPRSNAISRIILQYEEIYQDDTAYYRRHTMPFFPLEYTYIQRYDYTGRLFTDMSLMDTPAQIMIHHYYGTIQRNRDLKNRINIFSANKQFHRKSKPPLASLTCSQDDKRADQSVFYDHFTETLLPNLFSSNWQENVLIVCHGIRELGTFAGLLALANNKHLYGDPEHSRVGFKDRLEACANRFAKKDFSASQKGWSVFRPIQCHNGDLLNQQLVKRLTSTVFNSSNSVKFNEQSIYFNEHIEKQAIKSEDFKVEHKDIERFHTALNKDLDYLKNKDASTSANQSKGTTLDSEQILDGLSLSRDKFMRRHGIYTLGCFERKKTVYTQQARALTLIHALHKSGKLSKDKKVCIVGGGASGIAAAIAASEIGARVVLVDNNSELCSIQRLSSHRYLHPHFYDWPVAGSNNIKTDFPIEALDWTARNADCVFNTIVNNFDRYREDVNKSGDRQLLQYKNNFTVRLVLYDRLNEKHLVVNRRISPQDDWKTTASNLVRNIRSGDYTRYKNKLKPDDVVDCDILIFATGFGADTVAPQGTDNPITNPSIILNNSYWQPDTLLKNIELKAGDVFIVSGSGDGALIDILRLCIKEFGDSYAWHKEFTIKMCELIEPKLNGAIWINRRDLLVFADELDKLFKSDQFKLTEGETARLELIEKTMNGFDIDAFLEQLNIRLNDIEIYNVADSPQPFWSDSSTAHRLLIWCLFKKGRIRFISGRVIKQKGRDLITIKRTLTGKTREIQIKGLILRHGVAEQPYNFLKIQGLLAEFDDGGYDRIKNDGNRLVSLLRLSNTLHPETEMFFSHRIKHFN